MDSGAGKVVVIGLDGATFTLLKPWMEAGHLPYLKSLVVQGAHGPLQSSFPPLTSPAWQCFLTGKNPGKLGITGFFEARPNGYEGTLISAGGYEGQTLWDILNRDGKRVAVLNVPFTVPPAGFNGVIIGGFDTPPSKMAEAVHPAGLLKELEDRFGPYPTDLRVPPFVLANRSEPLVDAFLRDCQEITDYQFRVAHDLLDRQQFDVMMFYQLPTDRIQHRLWYVLDRTHPWYDPRIAQRFSDRIVAYYRSLDAQMARLVERFGPDPTVLVVSDHGFGPITRMIDLNSFLLRAGYIRIRTRASSRLKFLLWRLGLGPGLLLALLRRPLRWGFVRRWLTRLYNARGKRNVTVEVGQIAKRLFLSLDDIDWSGTRAYCRTGPGLIRINLQGREPEGAVPPEAYADLRDEIVAKLKELVDPTTGQRVDGQVFTREEIYHGKFLDDMPDILYMAYEENYAAGNPIAFISSRIFFESPGPSGFHRMDGILVARGPAIRKGVVIEGATIMDIAPTILYLSGSQIPRDMDGRVLTGLFEEEFRQTHPIVYTEPVSPEGERPAVELTQEDQEAILARLKGLGYVD